jgi:hypothetical protein
MIVTDPVLVRGAVGTKVTLTVQLRLGAREVPQVLVSAKSPLVVMARFSAVFCSFVTVKVCAALVLPTARLENVRLLGATKAIGTIFVTKASFEPPNRLWNELEVTEKLVDDVCPVT